MRLKTLLICAVTVLTVKSATTEKEKLEKPLIDLLTLDYLSVSQGLWSVIKTHADRRTVVARINDEHRRFFGSDFGETASLRHAYYVPDGEAREYYFQFIQNLQRLNSNFQTASGVAQLLTQNDTAIGYAIDRFENDIYVHSIQLSDSIFEEVSEARFWNKGKSVRLRRIN